MNEFTTPFKAKTLEEERPKDEGKILTLRVNNEELQQIIAAGKFLEQKKLSTTIKQLAFIGLNVIQDKKINRILQVLFKNKRNNRIQGFSDFD